MGETTVGLGGRESLGGVQGRSSIRGLGTKYPQAGNFKSSYKQFLRIFLVGFQPFSPTPMFFSCLQASFH